MAQNSKQHQAKEDDYISQFLDFEPGEKPHKIDSHDQEISIQPKEDPDLPDQIYEQSSLYDDTSSAFQKSKRSPLHNFQKHFVTTIRRSVRLKWPSQCSGYLKLAQEMWEVFKNSRKYTKQFVSLILGQNESKIDPQLLKKYGLLECVNKYSQEQYHKAQFYLKSKVIETFKSIPKQKIMYQRRIEKKEEFANYFFKILSEIQEGAMNKRLPKKRCKGRKNSQSKVNKQNIETSQVKMEKRAQKV